jgi:hypothetical protein
MEQPKDFWGAEETRRKLEFGYADHERVARGAEGILS